MMKVQKKTCIVVTLIALLALKIFQNSESRAAVRTGKVNEFWYVVCGVDVDGSVHSRGLWAGQLGIRDEWAYYSIVGYCGDMYYRIRLSDAATELPKVVQLVKAKKQDGSLPNFYAIAFESRRSREYSADDVRDSVNTILTAQFQHLQDTSMERVQLDQQAKQIFNDRLERSKRYWVTLLFEFFWLSSVAILILVPWLRSGGRLLWSMCVAFAPLVLFFPIWCGYCDYTFSSCFPDGGVLYPDVVRGFPIFFELSQIDSWLIARCPPLFDSFAQNPNGKDASALLHFPPPGPISLFLTCLVPVFIANAVLPVVWLCRRYRSHGNHGAMHGRKSGTQ